MQVQRWEGRWAPGVLFMIEHYTLTRIIVIVIYGARVLMQVHVWELSWNHTTSNSHFLCMSMYIAIAIAILLQ